MVRILQGPRCTSTARLDGKTVVITGANTGIGKETARDLSRRGARIVLACRDVEKTKIAAEEIKQETGNPVDIVKLDLASLESVRQAAKEILEKESRIDILINNAGIMMCPQWKTTDGFEMQFGVNHLGHFLFTLLLIERIKASAPARIVNLSSIAHRGKGKIDFDDIMFEKRKYDAMTSYRQSKLANILFTKELAGRLTGTGVTAYAVHPGVVQTELGRHINSVFGSLAEKGMKWIGSFAFKTPEMGAMTSIYCAVDEGLANESGKYYSDCKETQPTCQARDMEVARRLWDLSLRLVNLENPAV